MGQRKDASRARLQEAAFALYSERGFAETTVTAIAERAGVTERTFFRHFADKREVLFANEDALTERLVAAVSSDAGTPTWEAVTTGLEAIAAQLTPRHAELRRRQPVIAAHPELRERERMKLASWTVALEDALITRGAAPHEAQLAAAMGIAILDAAARRWLETEAPADLAAVLRDTAHQASALV